MDALEATGANAEQIRYWNEVAGPKWIAFQQAIDAQISPLGRRAMDRAAIAAGERVLDVGCGCGETTLELARRVGPAGRVTGIDLSTAMLERAKGEARAAGLTNVRFENADAQTHSFPPAGFDLLYSRFGVMFFTDPAAAFANLGSALRPGGRIAFVCWQALQRNPWMFVPVVAASKHIALPPPPGPEAPGPFSFADPERVRGILTRGGFAAIELEEVLETLTVGGGADFEQTVNFLLQVGPTGAALREAPSDAASRVTAAVREALAPYRTAQGVRMESASWVVTARRT
jgi:SAM-dependent methyltransferase